MKKLLEDIKSSSLTRKTDISEVQQKNCKVSSFIRKKANKKINPCSEKYSEKSKDFK